MKNLLNRAAAILGLAATLTFGADAQAQRILIDCGWSFDETIGTPTGPAVFGPSGIVYWNDFKQGTFAGSLVTTTNQVTTIGIGAGAGSALPVGTNGALGNGDPATGTSDPAFLGDFAVDSATGDYIFTADGGSAAIVTLVVSGLDAGLEYNFRFFGSRVSTDDRITQYTVTGAASAMTTLQTSGTNIGSDGMSFGNDNEIAEILNVVPRMDGTVDIEITAQTGGFGYLNILEIEVVAPIDFTTQPTSQVVDAGGTLNFVCAVDDGGLGATLQWQKDGVDLVDGGDISGATTNSLTIVNASAEDVGEYTCVASAAGASVTSEVAVGAVRQSASAFDVNGDGSIDFFDVAALLDVL
ncbi:MAG: hypothetical protein Tsb0013_03400 [Phycisphaerales bacterium]